MRAPVDYISNFIPTPDAMFARLWAELPWERRGSTPRRETYSSTLNLPYAYGTGLGVREYLPQVWHPLLLEIKEAVEAYADVKFEACFVNGYENSRDQLGWHSDNSVEMDDELPIAIISFGARREILFREMRNDETRESLMLDSGSLCLMRAGMQDTHEHRIPKAGYDCGPRVSLTLRGDIRRSS